METPEPEPVETIELEVWSDLVCPWCYLGKCRLEKALTQYHNAEVQRAEARRAEVSVTWRSFQLDPSHPRHEPRSVYEYLARKVGGSLAQARAMTDHVKALAAAEGLAYDFDRAQYVNTFDGHRLTQLARVHGVGGEMHERLMRAHLVDGENVDDEKTLVRLGAEVGVPVEEARQMLAGDGYSAAVRADLREAAALGINGVPFFVLDRTYGLSGAQPVEVFLAALRKAAEPARSRPLRSTG